MPDSVITLLQDLIAIDSVNPSLVPGAAGETDMAECVARELQASGLDVDRQSVTAGRSNVIASLEGSQKGRTLMLCGHMDTVGVAGMQSPFDPLQKDGRIYGRGSQDMKGGLAAMMSAAMHLAGNKRWTKGRLIVAAVIDEEYASIGAETLVQEWKADAAIVGEPTDMKIAVGHKGFEWVEVTTKGVAAHGSRPADGRDAILRMGRVLGRLERLDRGLQARQPHPVHGTPSLHASIVSGGREWSTYPDQCLLKMERRTIEGEANQCGLLEVQNILQELRLEDSEFTASASAVFSRPPYLARFSENDLPEMIAAALVRRGLSPATGGMSFWTDAAILGAAGIPSIIFGPGGAGLHSITEYVVAADVLLCRDAIVELAPEFCSI